MKRVFSLVITLLLVSIIPASVIKAQDKKNEQKIKIIVSDGSGTKIIIDTLIKDGDGKDPIVLKDGKVIVISKSGDGVAMSGDNKEHVFVTVTSDGKDSEKNEMEKTIVYMNSDGDNKKGIEKSYDVTVTTDDKGDRVEKSSYLIAKDGIVVSVEGGDDSKTKELVKDIEKLMGIDKKDDSKKETVKVETKKVVKK